ncbi:inactive dipeptidyl peptidase 10-like isoform X2 [Cephus cinctus]|uniref:Inactive dipeptidyl peptidase 10-like isoform X2 n=1 Tax=Cephus cinctus TaxID=211228 RepID=A0AAJ7RHP4_CEPCN|nr:inactive dipeptidyl peptidase 10-like isoform X2 [Cephus cinctus]
MFCMARVSQYDTKFSKRTSQRDNNDESSLFLNHVKYGKEYFVCVETKACENLDGCENSEDEDGTPLIRQKYNDSVMSEERHILRNRRTNSWDGHMELMTKNKRRSWRRILAGAVVGLVILALVITAIIYLVGHSESADKQTPVKDGLTLEEWLSGSLSTNSFNGTWLSDEEILYMDESRNLKIHNVTSNSSTIVLETTNSALASSFQHQISADRKYLLLASNYQKLYRHTYLAQYKIINLQTLTETSLGINGTYMLQLAVWAPQGNALIHVIQNNIYYRPEAEVATDYQITTSGVFGSIYNGVPDWVYEGE